MKKIAVLGMGIFGTALALTASRAGNAVLGWARNPQVVDDINQKHVNLKYLPAIPLPENIRATSDVSELFSFADVLRRFGFALSCYFIFHLPHLCDKEIYQIFPYI